LWRLDLMGTVSILATDSKRVCANRISIYKLKLLFVNVYTPYEGSDDMSANFVDQLSVIEDLINNNCDCHAIIGSDFNVDFTREKLHTALLSSFCDNLHLNPVVRHSKCTVDYTYNFNEQV
jgi:hypothetical protein